MNLEEALQEIEELKDALKEAEDEVKDKESEIEDLEKKIDNLESEIYDLENQDNGVDFGGLVANMKYEYFMENFDKISLEQLEKLI